MADDETAGEEEADVEREEKLPENAGLVGEKGDDGRRDEEAGEVGRSVGGRIDVVVGVLWLILAFVGLLW